MCVESYRETTFWNFQSHCLGWRSQIILAGGSSGLGNCRHAKHPQRIACYLRGSNKFLQPWQLADFQAIRFPSHLYRGLQKSSIIFAFEPFSSFQTSDMIGSGFSTPLKEGKKAWLSPLHAAWLLMFIGQFIRPPWERRVSPFFFWVITVVNENKNLPTYFSVL